MLFFSIEPINKAADRDRRFVGPSAVKQTIGRKVRIQGKRKDWREGEAGSNDRGLKGARRKEKNGGQGKRRREGERKEGERM